jgi:predicted Zn-dependent protease
MCFSLCGNDDTHEDKELVERRKLIQGLAAGGVLTATAPALSGCATNAETGARQFLLVGDRQLSQMAAASWADTKAKIPTSNDPRYTSRLRNIGNRISRGANKGNEQWDYAVFDRDTKNAFVLPGNRVGFFKGMMDFAGNDDQIAAIMGHEVGHVTGRHAAERVSQQMAGQIAVAGGTAVAGSQLGKQCRRQGEARIAGRTNISRAEGTAIQREYQQCMSGAHRNTQMLNAALGMGFTLGVVLPYSRKHESQSDLLGAKYMQKAGYDPYQSVKLWEKMAANSPSRQPEFMSTHPDPARRARDLHTYIKYQESLGSQGWQSIKMPKDKKA